MLESTQVNFTVTDLVHGWDDVRLLLNPADPDELYAALSSWPRQRAVTALVAAATVLRPEEVVAGHSRPSGPDNAATGQRSSHGRGRPRGRPAVRSGLATVTATTIPGGTGQRGQVTGQGAATVRPPVMAGAVQPRSDTDGVGLTCLVCGEPFIAARRDRRTCSRRCARRDRTARRQSREATEGRTCAGCGGVFFGGRADRRHCDVRCRMRAHRRRQRARRVAAPEAGGVR